ncbi:MAPEG family protein [Pseudooceanicola sp. MF1-13]|uniref:MAPEG family protein n=1 Tax=Pseudooceanicola sp. MF1-13 TaxID=3379095 RepID=UPI0038917CB3
MTPELAALAATAFIHLVAVGWSQKELTKDVGTDGNAGPRDGDLDISTRTARLRRALANHTENIGPFIIAVVLVELTDTNSLLTAIAAWVFVAARTLYLPAYAFAWVPWRSAIYTVGLIATFTMIIRSFF